MKLKSVLAVAVLLTGLVNCSHSSTVMDPCGMVPPIYTGPGVPIVRTGLQQTYVFYKDGVETLVIRPGFQGSVEDFGMLIPFPEPPALRKVPDQVFDHIDRAIDPPEVVVDLTPGKIRTRNGMFDFDGDPEGGLRLERDQIDEVVVVREEAVGMYEVAVLAAGSPESLKRWMDEHGYQYPEGMDKVAAQYIDDGWCFVAVKTRVGRATGAEPAAGQRAVDTNKPEESLFTGAVQGMGFRFRCDELVVPMRLSAFNDGELRNVVYVLADSPKRIRNIPEEYVVRQITGDTLIRNMTQPLPLRIIGGEEKDIPDWRRRSLAHERDPAPHNEVAKNLFASDLMAVQSDNLSLELEETEKQILQINEHFGLRGPEIDSVIHEQQRTASEEIVDAALEGLAEMTLTLVDGDFPRQVLANENLGFANYTMPENRNQQRLYDSKSHSEPTNWLGEQGILIGQVDLEVWQSGRQRSASHWVWLFAGLGMACVIIVLQRYSG